MRIFRVGTRFFIIESERDLHDVSLKVLNEERITGRLPEVAQVFVEQICDEMDGDSAFRVIKGMFDSQLIAPEVL